MNRDVLEAVVLERSLRRVFGSDVSPVVEAALAQDGDPSRHWRMVGARLSVELDERIESVAGALDMKKRRFIEVALASAVERAERIMADEGLDEEATPAVRVVEA